MKTSVKIEKCCRRAGGLVFGVRIVFPINIVDFGRKISYYSFGVSFGLIFWELRFGFDFGFKTV